MTAITVTLHEYTEALRRGVLTTPGDLVPVIVETFTNGDEYWHLDPQNSHAGYNATFGMIPIDQFLAEHDNLADGVVSRLCVDCPARLRGTSAAGLTDELRAALRWLHDARGVVDGNRGNDTAPAALLAEAGLLLAQYDQLPGTSANLTDELPETRATLAGFYEQVRTTVASREEAEGPDYGPDSAWVAVYPNWDESDYMMLHDLFGAAFVHAPVDTLPQIAVWSSKIKRLLLRVPCAVEKRLIVHTDGVVARGDWTADEITSAISMAGGRYQSGEDIEVFLVAHRAAAA